MCKKVAILDQARTQHKRPLLRPVELTPDETQRLVYAFMRGNSAIREEDCLTLVQWATAQRMGAMIVEMILDGEVIPTVHNGEVRVTLPGRPHEEETHNAS